MKRYPAYKDSGIEWIGCIPISWGIVPIRALCYLGRGRVISNEEIGENVGEYPVYSSQTTENGLMGRLNTYDFDGEYVTWTTDGANAGTVFYRYGKFNCTNVCGTLKAKNGKVYLKYLPYVLNLGTKCYVRYDINPKLMNNEMAAIRVPLPEYSEQKVIADYLDRKTAQIDALITKKERMIELFKEERTAIINQAVTHGINDVGANDYSPLQKNVALLNRYPAYKDSGIDWLGKVPKHWEIKKLKFLCRKIGSGITPKGGAAIYLTEGVPILRSQNIHFNELKLDDVAYISEDMHREMSATRVLSGDVLLNITGASIGRCNYWQEKSEANVNQHVCIIRPTIKIGTKYLYYCLSSEIGQRQIDLSQKGISREGLNYEELASFLVPLPNDKEQRMIIDYLDNKIALIHAQAAREQKSIELLKEYRTSLISEAVTGKIDVRNQ